MSSRTGSIVDSETSIAPRTDSSASRFWGGTMVGVPLVANCSSVSRRGSLDRAAETLSSLDIGPADPRLPRGGTKSARAWLENHRQPRGAAKLWLFAGAGIRARIVPGEEGRFLRP